MVVCAPHIEEYQRDLQQAIQEMSGNLPVASEGDEFESFLKKYGVDVQTMQKLRNAGCHNVAGLQHLDDSDVDDLEGLPKLQVKYVKKALGDLRGGGAVTVAVEEKKEAITVQGCPLNVTGASEGARVMIVEGAAVQSAGGRLNVSQSPVTAKDVQGNVNIGAVLK